MEINRNSIVDFADTMLKLAQNMKEASEKLPDAEKKKIQTVLEEIKFDDKIRELKEVQNKFNNIFKNL